MRELIGETSSPGPRRRPDPSRSSSAATASSPPLDAALARRARRIDGRHRERTARHRQVVARQCVPRSRPRRHRVHAYQGRCLELESVPFKGLDGAIDMMCNELSRRRYDEAKRLAPTDVAALVQMFPMLKRVEAFSRRALVRRSAALRKHAMPRRTRCASCSPTSPTDGPVIVFVDDLQWASDDTVRLLLELLAPPAPPLLLVVAYRSGELGDAAIVDRFSNGLAERGVAPIDLDLAPLEPAAIDRWIAQPRREPFDDRAALRETAGHPHLLARLLELGSRGSDQPVELTAVLAAELAQLDPRARALLDIISIAGGPIRQQAAFEAAGVSRDPATLDHLRRRKLIQSSTADVQVEAYHDRVREVALAALPAERRRELHLALAHALERSELAEPDALARHYREAGDTASALSWTLRAAGHATATLAFARAVELYRAAVPLASDERAAARGARRACRRAGAAWPAQRCRADVPRRGCAREELGRDGEHAALRAKAGEHFLLAGQLERGFELLRDALAEVAVTLPQTAAVAVAESFNVGGCARGSRARGSAPRARSDDTRLVQRVDLELAVARSLTQTDLRGPLMAARGLADALLLGEPSRIQRALSLFVLNHAARMPDDALMNDAEAKAYDLAEQLGDEVGLAWAAIATGFHAIYRHEFATALRALDEAERRFLALPGYPREAALARLAIVLVCGNYGIDLAYAQRRHAGFIDEMLARGDVFSATWGRFVQILIALATGNPQQARALVETVTDDVAQREGGLAALGVAAGPQVAIELYENPAGAWDALCAIEPEYQQMFSSMIPVTIQLHARIAANCAVAAFVDGRASRTTTLSASTRCSNGSPTSHSARST